MTRIPIRLSNESLTALQMLARQEYRDVRQQAAWIIENELAKRGLLQLTQADAAPLPNGDTTTVMPAKGPKQEQEETYVAG